MTEYWDEYTQQCWNMLLCSLKKESTVKSYQQILFDFISFTKKPFWQSTEYDIQKYYIFCNKNINDGVCTGSTVFKKFKVLRRIMNYMISVAGEIHLPFIPVNEFEPFTRMLLDYDQHYYVRPVSIEDIDRLLISCSSDLQLYAIISLIYKTGIRPQEICRLKFQDIFSQPDGTYLQVKREKKFDFILLPEDICLILNRYLADFASKPPLSSPLFRNKYGKALDIRTLQSDFHDLVKKCGIDNCTIYDVRNASAMLMLAYDADPKKIAKQMGIRIESIQRYKRNIIPSNLIRAEGTTINIQISPPKDGY